MLALPITAFVTLRSAGVDQVAPPSEEVAACVRLGVPTVVHTAAWRWPSAETVMSGA